jgi:hypothetical protein
VSSGGRGLGESGEATKITRHRRELDTAALGDACEAALPNEARKLGRKEAGEKLTALSLHDVIADRPEEEGHLADCGEDGGDVVPHGDHHGPEWCGDKRGPETNLFRRIESAP